MEIILLALGGVVFVLSFFIPDKKEAEGIDVQALAGDEVKKLVNQEVEAIRSHVDDVVEETITCAMEKTERSLERLSNEKIMAVSEYSDTVLAEIHKNHEETMFLYDMLNNKQASLKDTVAEINRTVKEAEETVTSFKKLSSEIVVPEQAALGEAVLSEEVVPGEAVRGNKTPSGKNQSRKNSSRRNSSRKSSSNKKPSGQTFQPKAIAEQEFSQLFPEVEDMHSDQADGENQDQQEQNNNERILELYRAGKSAVDIAKELELGVGEVKLVIDLFKVHA